MAFRFNLAKAIQAAGVLFRQENRDRIGRLRLVKLLYLADRRSLGETGQPITGDRVVAMEHGPVLSNVYDCTKGSSFRLAQWERFFASEGYEVRQVQKPPVDELCKYEIEVLQQVARESADKDDWQIARETHDLAEWQQNYCQGTSTEIPFADILRAVGRGGQAEAILAEARRTAELDRIFAGGR
jgi:uncharacterized phage-associated protein